jgi:hypothetical protein
MKTFGVPSRLGSRSDPRWRLPRVRLSPARSGALSARSPPTADVRRRRPRRTIHTRRERVTRDARRRSTSRGSRSRAPSYRPGRRGTTPGRARHDRRSRRPHSPRPVVARHPRSPHLDQAAAGPETRPKMLAGRAARRGPCRRPPGCDPQERSPRLRPRPPASRSCDPSRRASRTARRHPQPVPPSVRRSASTSPEDATGALCGRRRTVAPGRSRVSLSRWRRPRSKVVFYW